MLKSFIKLLNVPITTLDLIIFYIIYKFIELIIQIIMRFF